MKNKIVLPALLALMLVVSACGSSAAASQSTDTPIATSLPVATATQMATAMPVATATMAPAATSTSGAVVNVGQTAALGSFLVDSAGMTLYIFTKDTPGVSACYGGCASIWPPLLTKGTPIAGSGVTASLLGTTTRTDGSVQVTYNGWPLYYFNKDKVAGDTTGEGVQSVWYVMTPAGTQK